MAFDIMDILGGNEPVPSPAQREIIDPFPSAPGPNADLTQPGLSDFDDFNMDSAVDQEFITFLKEMEGEVRNDEGMHVPFVGVAGEELIGFGHKVLPGEESFSRPINDREANQLLYTDAVDHEVRAERQFDDVVNRPGAYRKLGKSLKKAVTDYAYTGGVLNFPKLMNAIADGDLEKALKENDRATKVLGSDGQIEVDEKGEFKRLNLTTRNQGIANWLVQGLRPSDHEVVLP